MKRTALFILLTLFCQPLLHAEVVTAAPTQEFEQPAEQESWKQRFKRGAQEFVKSPWGKAVGGIAAAVTVLATYLLLRDQKPQVGEIPDIPLIKKKNKEPLPIDPQLEKQKKAAAAIEHEWQRYKKASDAIEKARRSYQSTWREMQKREEVPVSAEEELERRKTLSTEELLSLQDVGAAVAKYSQPTELDNKLFPGGVETFETNLIAPQTDVYENYSVTVEYSSGSTDTVQLGKLELTQLPVLYQNVSAIGGRENHCGYYALFFAGLLASHPELNARELDQQKLLKNRAHFIPFFRKALEQIAQRRAQRSVNELNNVSEPHLNIPGIALLSEEEFVHLQDLVAQEFSLRDFERFQVGPEFISTARDNFEGQIEAKVVGSIQSQLIPQRIKLFMWRNKEETDVARHVYIVNNSIRGSHYQALSLEKRDGVTYAILADSLGIERLDDIRQQLKE